MSDIEASRETYAKLNANNSGPHCQGQTSQEAQAALDEIDHLRAWKAEATAVINGWERVFEMVPAPFRAQHLGAFKADVVLAYFRAVDNRHAW